ncbi:hypothetical protein SGPA1_30961 [Streptomyces misionensis JCM 4497]
MRVHTRFTRHLCLREAALNDPHDDRGTARQGERGRRPGTRLRGHRGRGDADPARAGHQRPAATAAHRTQQRHLGAHLDPAVRRRRHPDHGPARRPVRQAAHADRQPRRDGDRRPGQRLHQPAAHHDRGPHSPGLRDGRDPPRHRPDAGHAAARTARLRHGPDELLHRRGRRPRPARRRPGRPAHRLARAVLRRRRPRRARHRPDPPRRPRVPDARAGLLRPARRARPLRRSGAVPAAHHQGQRLGLGLRHHPRPVPRRGRRARPVGPVRAARRSAAGRSAHHRPARRALHQPGVDHGRCRVLRRLAGPAPAAPAAEGHRVRPRPVHGRRRSVRGPAGPDDDVHRAGLRPPLRPLRAPDHPHHRPADHRRRLRRRARPDEGALGDDPHLRDPRRGHRPRLLLPARPDRRRGPGVGDRRRQRPQHADAVHRHLRVQRRHRHGAGQHGAHGRGPRDPHDARVPGVLPHRHRRGGGRPGDGAVPAEDRPRAAAARAAARQQRGGRRAGAGRGRAAGLPGAGAGPGRGPRGPGQGDAHRPARPAGGVGGLRRRRRLRAGRTRAGGVRPRGAGGRVRAAGLRRHALRRGADRRGGPRPAG